VRQRAAEAQAGFVLTLQYPKLQTRDLLHAREEQLRVLRVAHRAGGNRLHAIGVELLRERRHALQRVDREVHGLGRERAAGIQPFAEARMRLHLVHDLDAAVSANVGDDLADRIRAHVDGGDAPDRGWCCGGTRHS
jgi:hypothetical protein